LRVEPDNVASFGRTWRGNFAEPPAQACAVLGLGTNFRSATRFARIHQNESVIGRKRGVVRVDGVESEGRGRWQGYDLGSGVGKQAAKSFVL
jgi:hypothetical protein